MYELTVWYRKNNKIHKYSDLISDYSDCLTIITRVKKYYALIRVIINNKMEDYIKEENMEDNKIVSVLNNSLSKKKIKFKDYYGDNHVLNIKAGTYYFTGNLSLQAYEEGLPYARITVNIEPLPPNEAA